MKTRATYLLMDVFICMVLVSCGKDYIEQTKSNISLENDSNSTIPIEKALSSLDKLMSELYGATKATNQNYSVEVFGGVKTKSSNLSLPDTTLYLVNMENGYAVLSAQKKIKTDVFCITESGTISSEDIQNAIYNLEHTDDANKSVESDDIEDDFEDMGRETIPSIIAASVVNQLYYGYEPEYDTDETKANTYRGTPNTLAMLQTKWRQGYPFNKFRTDAAPVGCVAIATAQIIEFNALKHGYVSFVNDGNKTFNWNSLFTVCHCSDRFYLGDSFAQKQASDFLEYLGLKKNCDIKYKTTGSSGSSMGAKRTFKNMGYESVKIHLGFSKADKNRVISQLTNGFPMYMDGSGKGSGHAWVLDGIYVRKVYTETNDYLRTENLFHINWGWGGICDGYYSQGVFDTSQRQDTEAGIDPGVSVQPSYSYTWNYSTVSYSL